LQELAKRLTVGEVLAMEEVRTSIQQHGLFVPESVKWILNVGMCVYVCV
jgi:hypothetical protein